MKNQPISPAEQLKQHVIFVSHYVLTFLKTIEDEEGQPSALERIISRAELKALIHEGAKDELSESMQNILRTYVCYDYMNKLLVSSKYDEIMIAQLLKDELPDSNPLRNFIVFRGEMLKLNMRLMQHLDKKFGTHEKLIMLKKQLQEITA